MGEIPFVPMGKTVAAVLVIGSRLLGRSEYL
jgi:hypothetical protein